MSDSIFYNDSDFNIARKRLRAVLATIKPGVTDKQSNELIRYSYLIINTLNNIKGKNK